MLEDLESADLHDSFEISSLKKDQDRLVNGVSLQSSISLLLSYLELGTDQFPSIMELFGICSNEFQKMVKMDSSLASIYDKFINLSIDLKELIRDINMSGEIKQTITK